jgi:phosphoglycolate phosphatase
VSSKLLLFDLDWTIVYTGGAGLLALDYAFLKHFQIPDAIKNITPDGKTDPAIVREMIRVHLGRDAQKNEIETVCKTYVERLPAEVARAKGYIILPGIPDLLKALSQTSDVWVGLGTGNLEGGARAKLARTDLQLHFKFGGYADDSENRPDVLRAGVRRGEQRAGRAFNPRDVIVIGDNFRDIEAGQAIGAVTVGVATGHMTTSDLSVYKPDFLFKDLSDTQAVLKAFLS